MDFRRLLSIATLISSGDFRDVFGGSGVKATVKGVIVKALTQFKSHEIRGSRRYASADQGIKTIFTVPASP